ncbi:unnamed protein product [Arabis nemorensis]|uniref:Uncharacterized protein n=1 Tax=Arabis nemorensis TaxID=586526 RepID=A0A565ASU9_9BRAS|nr:unnamed protein product [Arabis nemorensis]
MHYSAVGPSTLQIDLDTRHDELAARGCASPRLEGTMRSGTRKSTAQGHDKSTTQDAQTRISRTFQSAV